LLPLSALREAAGAPILEELGFYLKVELERIHGLH
jgi:hypothetical protein